MFDRVKTFIAKRKAWSLQYGKAALVKEAVTLDMYQSRYYVRTNLLLRVGGNSIDTVY